MTATDAEIIPFRSAFAKDACRRLDQYRAAIKAADPYQDLTQGEPCVRIPMSQATISELDHSIYVSIEVVINALRRHAEGQ